MAKKTIGHFTADATKALKGAERIICTLADDGIYITTGTILFKMSDAEYDAAARPVVMCDAGNWQIYDGEKTPSAMDVKKLMEGIVKNAENGDFLKSCPMCAKTTDEKINLASFYSESGDFAVFYQEHYIGAYAAGFKIKAASPVQPAIIYHGDDITGVICPMKPAAEVARAVKAYFNAEPQPDAQSAEKIKKLEARAADMESIARQEEARANENFSRAAELEKRIAELEKALKEAKKQEPEKEEKAEEKEEEKMTNNEIIYRAQLLLMQEGLISGTVAQPEEIHTFAYWKNVGRSVKKGEKAITKLCLWKHTGKKSTDENGEEVTEDGAMIKKTSYFFALHQTEPAIKREEVKEEAEEAKQEPAQEAQPEEVKEEPAQEPAAAEPAQEEPQQEQEAEKPEEPQQEEPQPEEENFSVTPHYYEINEKAAATAKHMMSYDDYKAGSATAEYRAHIDDVTKIFSAELEKCQTEAQREHAKALYEKYCKAYAEYINRENEIGTRCPSILITGRSNFPVRKKEKQVAAWEKNHEYYKYTQEILEKLKGVHRQGLRSDDPEALPAMREKLERLKATQEDMKRKNAEARKAGQPQPCPAWALSNNNANIHRVESRVKELEAAQNTETVTIEKDGYTYEENTADMRVRFIFSGKPDDQTREALKSNGFRWAPSVGAWQRQLNANGKYAAEKVMKTLEA